MVHGRDYQRRIVDDELDELIDGGAVAIALEGAKGVGKTATGSARTDTMLYLDQPDVRTMVQADVAAVTAMGPVLIDEWQHVPATWDVVRRAVDSGASPGQFLLTGSASPPRPGTHSGAGRILSLRMRPMTLSERGVEQPTVSLRSLLSGARPTVIGSTQVRLATYLEEIVRSGFPGIRNLGPRLRDEQLHAYLSRVIDREVTDATGRGMRNPAALRRWLTAYAAATATCASFESVRDAATGGHGDKPARSTSLVYRDALESLFLLEPVPAWAPTFNHIAELAAAPKHHLVDPALAVSLLGLDTSGLAPVAGALFESLVTLDVRVYAQAAHAQVGHLRTHRGQHEVDLIVERRDQRVVAIEVKLAADVTDHDARHLLWLKQQLGDRLLDSVVVTTGRHAYRRADGVAVVPAALLGP